MTSVLEICAGGGGSALGLEAAGFEPVALVDNDPHACATLRHNRPHWEVLLEDVTTFDGSAHRGVDLLAGGVPCPPFSVAGKQLGADDERDLFPAVLRIAAECQPRAILVENVRGLLDPVFADYRHSIEHELQALQDLQYRVAGWVMLQASDFGVPQLRPRVFMVALREDTAGHFQWPKPRQERPPTVGEALYDEMASRGWRRAKSWRRKANRIAPTLVGGSKKHGGPDLGPTRARRAWAELGVDGKALAAEPPASDFVGMPRLTVPMTAILQGFPRDWELVGKKTQAYRQVGNACPPPLAAAVGHAIHAALAATSNEDEADSSRGQ